MRPKLTRTARAPSVPISSTSPKATGATGPSASITRPKSTLRRPSATLNSPLLRAMKRLPSVMPCARDTSRRPTRSASVIREANCTAWRNQSRCASCASDRRSRILRG
ncbi:MAG: hypothetical protein J6X88_02140 [Bacteroidales bacterium]|nr:hypothetical protein [Bacteroidales bacterium]